MLQSAQNLTDQVYGAIVDEICDGRLAAGTHLVQERLAERFDVSRQPIQQAMSRLKADGMVEEVGRRGLFVTRLHPGRMIDHYGVRAALDGWAARTATLRLSGEPETRESFAQGARALCDSAGAAMAANDVAGLVRLDSALHFKIYDATGNAMIASTAEPHWRFLRRAMGDVLRTVEAPGEIWRQHAEILDAVIAGDAAAAGERAEIHVAGAADRLADALLRSTAEDKP